MSKQAGPIKEKPKPIVIDTSTSIPATTQEITIQLQKPNKNRELKAIVGIALIIISPTFVFQGIAEEESSILCFVLMGLGLSLTFQSFHRSQVSAVRGVSYFIISVFLVILTFVGLLILAFASMF